MPGVVADERHGCDSISSNHRIEFFYPVQRKTENRDSTVALGIRLYSLGQKFKEIHIFCK